MEEPRFLYSIEHQIEGQALPSGSNITQAHEYCKCFLVFLRKSFRRGQERSPAPRSGLPERKRVLIRFGPALIRQLLLLHLQVFENGPFLTGCIGTPLFFSLVILHKTLQLLVGKDRVDPFPGCFAAFLRLHALRNGRTSVGRDLCPQALAVLVLMNSFGRKDE